MALKLIGGGVKGLTTVTPHGRGAGEMSGKGDGQRFEYLKLYGTPYKL